MNVVVYKLFQRLQCELLNFHPSYVCLNIEGGKIELAFWGLEVQGE